MSEFDDVLAAAESLAPDDRLRLIARLWESLPADHWAAPDPVELESIQRRLGAARDRIVQPRPGFCERYLAKAEPGGPTLYSAPRRFDLATIFVVTAAYALLLTGLSLLGFYFSPLTRLLVASFITVVGVGQALLEDKLNPRAASIIVGAAANTLLALAIGLTVGHMPFIGLVFFSIFYGIICGGIFGYLAGVLVGGVFLVADLLRLRFADVGTAANSPLIKDSNPNE